MVDDNDRFGMFTELVSRRGLLRGTALGIGGLAAAALIGCDDDDDDDDDEPASGSEATATETVQGASSTEPPSSGGPVEGGTFRWQPTAPIGIPQDPHILGRGTYTWMYLSNVAVRWNASGNELTPELFQSWESADGMVHNVTVRPGVKTHDVPLTNGREFDAEDLALNLMRMSGLSDPENIALYWRRGGLLGMTDATAVDGSVVQVTFGEPAPHFPQGLTDYLTFIVPREDFEDPELFNHPTQLSGTGPFIFDEYRESEIQVYRRNPEFWAGAPYLDAVEVRQIGDRVSQMSSFLQGNAEYLENPSRVERETVSDQAPDAQIHAWPGSTSNYAKFNVTRAPLDDVRVRRALHLATDYVQNNTDYWGTGFFGVAGTISNAHGTSYTEEEVLAFPGWRVDGKDEDFTEASKLLDSAGFPGGAGLSFKIITSADRATYGYDFGIRQLDGWQQAFPDIKVEIDLAPDGTVATTRQTNGDFDYGFIPKVSTSPASVDASQHYQTGGSTNIGLYSNSDVDSLLQRARVTLDQDEASELVRQVEDITLEELPGMITHRLYQAGIYSGRVRGLPVIPGGDRALAGNFENWNSINRHTAVIWLEK